MAISSYVSFNTALLEYANYYYGNGTDAVPLIITSGYLYRGAG